MGVVRMTGEERICHPPYLSPPAKYANNLRLLGMNVGLGPHSYEDYD